MDDGPTMEGGFTLVELLISIFLAMTVMLIVAESTRQLSRSYFAVVADIEEAQNTRRTLAWMARLSRSDYEGVEVSDQRSSASIGSMMQLGLTSENGVLTGQQVRGETLDVPLGPENGYQLHAQGQTLLLLSDRPGALVFAVPLDRTIAWDCGFDAIARRCQ